MVSGTRTIRKNGISSLLGDVEEIKDPTYSIKEFNKPKVGYLAKKSIRFFDMFSKLLNWWFN
jgi:hypothetical protein